MLLQLNRLLLIIVSSLSLICIPAVAESNVKSAIRGFHKEMNTKPDYVESKDTDIWVQPSNKEVDCKIKTTKEFMKEDNAKIFWDGQCAIGYASGIGRHIYYSDSSHSEYIIIIFNDENILRPYMGLNYTEHSSFTGKIDQVNKVFEGRFERYADENSAKFDMNVMLGFLDMKTGRSTLAKFSPFKTESSIHITHDGKFYYYQRQFLADISPFDYVLGMIDGTTRKEGGARRYSHVDGTHHDEYFVGSKNFLGTSDDSAWQDIWPIIHQGQERLAQSFRYYEEAHAFGEKYKIEICAKRNTVIKGLPESAVYKLCTWQDDLQKKYDTRLTEYTEELELLKQAFQKKMKTKE